MGLGAGRICKLGCGQEKRQVAVNKRGDGEYVPVDGVEFSLPGNESRKAVGRLYPVMEMEVAPSPHPSEFYATPRTWWLLLGHLGCSSPFDLTHTRAHQGFWVRVDIWQLALPPETEWGKQIRRRWLPVPARLIFRVPLL